MPSRLQKNRLGAGRRPFRVVHATTAAAIWTIGEASTATSAVAAKRKLVISRDEGRVEVICVSPGAVRLR